MFGRFNADIIRDKTDNTYRGIFECDLCSCEVLGNGWRDFADNVKRDTGIEIPLKKHFVFEKLSDFEEIAGIDASHTRKSCIVTMQDRKNGWCRWELA